MTVVLKTNNISLVYHDGDKSSWAVRDVSIEIPNKKLLGIMGPSGSGKSSLLYLMSGLKRPSSGDVSFANRNYSDLSDNALVDLRRRRFGFVFQQPYLVTWQTAFENVMMGAQVINNESIDRAKSYFEQLGITNFMDKFPAQLSGGEKQRVCVARAMMNDPEVIFADEPTASLDHANGHLVVDLLAQYRDKGTVIIVTHDPEMLSDADTVLLMRDGESQGWVLPSEIDLGTIHHTADVNNL